MSVIGGIFRYTLVVLIIGLGLAVVLAGAMVMIPSLKIFGIHFIGQGSAVSYVVDNSEKNEVKYQHFVNSSSLVIDAGGYDVIVRTVGKNELPLNSVKGGGTDSFRFTVSNYLTGYAWGGVDAPTTTFGTEELNGEPIFKISIAEPEGWLFHSNTFIEIVIDANALADKTLIINGSGSGSITLGPRIVYTDDNTISEDIKLLNIKKLDINAQKGDVVFNYVNISNGIEIDKTEGTVESNINFQCPVSVKILGGYGKVFLKDIGSTSKNQSLDIEATNSEIRFNNLYGDLNFKALGGYLNAKNVKRSAILDCQSCDIILQSVDSIMSVKTTEGSVKIGNVGGNADVVTTQGNVELKQTKGEVRVETEKGNITLSNVFKQVYTKSLYGVIFVKWADGLSWNSSQEYKYGDMFKTTIESKYGSVSVENVIGPISMTAIENGSSAFSAKYLAINGKSTIKTNAGNVTLSLPINLPFYLGWTSVSNADINYLGSVVSSEKSGEVQFLGGQKTDSTDSSVTCNYQNIFVNTINGVFKARGAGYENY